MADLLSDIEAFCECHDIADTKFGFLALNDKAFVRDLRGADGKTPRRLWPETEAKVRRFMATYRPDNAAELAKAS